jgi:hypothetical protein
MCNKRPLPFMHSDSDKFSFFVVGSEAREVKHMMRRAWIISTSNENSDLCPLDWLDQAGYIAMHGKRLLINVEHSPHISHFESRDAQCMCLRDDDALRIRNFKLLISIITATATFWGNASIASRNYNGLMQWSFELLAWVCLRSSSYLPLPGFLGLATDIVNLLLCI